MQRRNAREPDPFTCHSRDFCDPDWVMIQAMEMVGFDLSGDFEEDEHLVGLWNAAWNFAKTKYLTAPVK
jgi:hypothetical protein